LPVPAFEALSAGAGWPDPVLRWPARPVARDAEGPIGLIKGSRSQSGRAALRRPFCLLMCMRLEMAQKRPRQYPLENLLPGVKPPLPSGCVRFERTPRTGPVRGSSRPLCGESGLVFLCLNLSDVTRSGHTYRSVGRKLFHSRGLAWNACLDGMCANRIGNTAVRARRQTRSHLTDQTCALGFRQIRHGLSPRTKLWCLGTP
jgi:hypothetical protein